MALHGISALETILATAPDTNAAGADSIDAKSVFDALIKECAGSRQDRRTAVDLAIVRATLTVQGSHVRWIPHPLMPADSMTKADLSAGNDALRHMLRTGQLVWDEETIRQSACLGRTKAVSRRQLEADNGTVHGPRAAALRPLWSSNFSDGDHFSAVKLAREIEASLASIIGCDTVSHTMAFFSRHGVESKALFPLSTS